MELPARTVPRLEGVRRVRRRSRRMLARSLRTALLAVLITAAGSPVASAGVASVSGSTLSFVADPGEINQVEMTSPPGVIQVDDIWAIVPGAGCAPVLGDPTRVHCGPSGAIDEVTISTSDRNDSVAEWTGLPSQIDGGEGNDNLDAGPGDDSVNGGPGDDLLRDRNVGGAPPSGDDIYSGLEGTDTVEYFRGFDGLTDIDLTVTLDGQPDDGSGAEADNVGADVESLVGGGGDDTLTGNGAANVLAGGGGVDAIFGGAGDDSLYGDFGDGDTLHGGPDDDLLDGGIGSDVHNGDGGDDIFRDDTLVNGPINDTFSGGDGIDLADYSAREETVVVDLDGEGADDGQAGEADTMGTDVEAIQGGSGDDELTGNGSNNRLDGGPGADVLAGLAGKDVVDYADSAEPVEVDLDGEAGDDGEPGEGDTAGADVEDALGGSGDDILVGNDAGNRLDGGLGADALYGDAGADTLEGGDGDDALDGGTAADLLRGGSGDDLADYADRAEDLSVDLDGEAGDDGAAGEGDTAGLDIETVWSGSGNDTVTGNASDNLLDGGLGADRISGLGGFDVTDYSVRISGVRVDLDGEPGDDGQGGEGDTNLSDIEDVLGGSGHDTLVGNGSENFLIGGAGDDLLEGLAGQDSLEGGSGDDTLRSRDGEGDDDVCGSGSDVAVADLEDFVEEDCEIVDFPASTSPPGPLAPVDRVAPAPAVRFRLVVDLATALRRGLSGTVTSNEGGTIVARAILAGRIARRLGLVASRPVVVATGRARLAAPGTTKVNLRFTKRARRKLRRAAKVQLTLRIAVTDAAGNTSLRRTRVTLKRNRR